MAASTNFVDVKLKALLARLILSASLSCIAAHSRGSEASAPNSKTYRNPLMPKREIADPDVIKIDGRYYLYPTSDTRGYQVFVSNDLVHWELKARAFEDPRGGDWAPEVIRYRSDGKFYLYYTDNVASDNPGTKQIGVAEAENPLGPFVDKGPLTSPAIDADPFQDDDGKLYLYYVDLANGFKIMVQLMATPTQKIGEMKELIRPTEPWEQISGHVTEGPFMLKHQGTYYLTYSGTGADSPNYGIGFATSKSPTGPFVKYPGNPIARHGGKVLGPGHHCVIEGPDKKLWLVYHQKWDAQKNFHRFLALDPIWFDDQGVLHTRVTRDTDEPAP